MAVSTRPSRIVFVAAGRSAIHEFIGGAALRFFGASLKVEQ
jgi:hypothetical protein